MSRCNSDVPTMISGSLLEYAELVWLIAATAEPRRSDSSLCLYLCINERTISNNCSATVKTTT